MEAVMFGIKAIVNVFSDIADKRPEDQANLLTFSSSSEIDDSDEQNLNLVMHVYPSTADLPSDDSARTPAIRNWQNTCQVLISGISIPIGIDYVDAKGDFTKRQVTVYKIIRSEGQLRYLTGFCHLRSSTRTFMEERIGEIIDLETGEIFERPAVFFDKYSLFDSPEMEKLQIALHILSYLARADRKFVDSEKGFLSKFIGEYCSGGKRAMIEDYAFNHKVKKADFLNEISKLNYIDETFAKSVVDKSKALIEIDGKVTKGEESLFSLLQAG